MKLDHGSFDETVRELGCRVLQREPMSLHTTFRIGGPADWFVTVETEEQLRALLPLLKERDISWMVLGNGSNLLVSDKGIRGAVLSLDGRFKEVSLLPDGVTVRAGAGAMLSAACAFARDNGLSWNLPGASPALWGARYI